MPLPIPSLPLRHRRSKSSSESRSASLPISPTIVVSDANGQAPQSILRATPSIASSEMTGSSTSASAFGKPSRAFVRSETTDSRWSIGDDENSITSTPATSVSSAQGMCPLPESSPGHEFPFFAMTLSSASTLSFIAMPSRLRVHVLETIRRAWKKGVKSSGEVDYAPELMAWHQKKGCDGGVWEVTMRDSAWLPKSEDKVSSKRIILNLMAEFARHGFELTSSYRTSAKDSGKDTMVFSVCEPDPDPVFFGVHCYSSDRIWIIDAPADVGQALEDGIKASWVDGLRAARVRERHCRELRLRGNPWTAHSSQSLINARVIQLVIMKHITHRSMGYSYAGSIDCADRDEGEMPLLVYRLDNRRVWGRMEQLPELRPISKAAAASMTL